MQAEAPYSLLSRTSRFIGMDAVAPGRETAIADAFAAISSPSLTGIPSMIEEIKYPVNKKQSFMVGDSTTDIEAGKNYGIKTIAVGERGLGADYQCSNLLEAAKYITGVTE